MERQSQRLSVHDLYRVKWLIGAFMALISVGALYNLKTHNWIPASVTVAAITLCVLLPKLYANAPAALWKIFAFSIVPLVSIDIFAKETVPALLNLNTWLILYRSLNHQKRREEMQLVLLCLFLLVMTGMLTASILFGLQLLVFAGLAISFLSIGTILDSKSAGASESIDPSDAWKEHSGWLNLAGSMRYRNVVIGSAMFSVLIGIAGFSFLFIPRVDVENKVNLFNMKGAASQTGFSESVQLGEVTSIKNDTRVALRVDVAGERVVPAMPYWRMLALDAYSNGGFSISPSLKEMLDDEDSTPYRAVRYWKDRWFADAPSRDQTRDRWTFFVEPGVSKFLPIVGSFKQFTYTNLNDVRIAPQMHAFALKETPSKMVSYQLEDVDFSARVPDVPAERMRDLSVRRVTNRVDSDSPEYPKTLLELPADEASRAYLSAVAREITGGAPINALEFATRAANYLSRTHSYSMNITLPPVTDIQDPVVRWLRSDLDGHCEFFASSFILLARAAGFESRVVIGFKGGAWNAFENYYMIRNSDAHAWCEIYDGVGNWIRVDPTPGSELPASPGSTVALESQIGESDSLAYVDSLRMLWYRRIVNFDEQSQKEVAIQLKDFFLAYMQVAEEWAIRAVKQIYDWIVAPWSLAKLFYTSTSLFIAVSILLFQRNLALNYRELLLAPFKRGDPIRRKASKLLAKSEQKRRKRSKGTPEDREAVISELKRLRFGRKETWPNPRLVFKEARRWL